MPLYAYHCDNCDQDFEKLVRFSDPNSNTPECRDANRGRRANAFQQLQRSVPGNPKALGVASVLALPLSRITFLRPVVWKE